MAPSSPPPPQLLGGVVVQALDVLDELAIDQDTCGCFATSDPGNNEVDGGLPALKVGPKRAGIEKGSLS